MQYVVDVGCHDQPLDRQPHLRRDIAGKDIAEIAGRHGEGNLAMRCAQLAGSVKIIDHLRHQPGPVDRVDRRDREAVGYFPIGEHPLHHRLGIIKTAIDRDIVHIRRPHRGHLPPLDIGDPAVRMEHEHIHLVPPRQRVNRGRTGVARGRADHRQMLVLPGQKFLEQQSEQLQGYILERKGWAVEQFEQPLPPVELHQRRHRSVGKAAIGLFANVAQLGFVERIADKGQHHPDGGFPVGKARHGGDLVGAERGP